MSQYPHYFKELPPGCTHVDVYRVLDLFGVVDPPIQHAVKKLLCAGERGSKTMPQDIAEAIATLQRWQQMREEEQPAPAEAREDAERRFGPITSDPAEAERNIRAKEDAERAAYLERWRNAPKWAEWLTQDGCRWCVWHERKPHEQGSFWRPDGAAKVAGAGHNLIGSVRCEPRPQLVEDPERAAYLARWERAPEWAQWRAKDPDNGRWYWVGDAPHPNWQEREPRPVPAGWQGVEG